MSDSRPESPQDFPYTVELDVGDYWFCTCGRSKNQPFCDGSHQGTDFQPVQFTITEKRTYSLCGCKKTQNPPFCDGSHNKR